MNKSRRAERRFRLTGSLLSAIVLMMFVGCSSIPPSNVKSNAKLTPNSRITRELAQLPRPVAKIPVAVYGLRDQTGQYKSYPDSSYSTLVTQGAATILVKALEDSGWYVPVEREGLQNLLTERRIIRAVENPADKSAKPAPPLPNLIPASLIMEGGVIAYESNVRTGGKGANYLGIGASNQYRVDQVTVILRNIDVRGGQVLNTVSVTKTIYSYQFSANIYKYVGYQSLLQAEAGYTTNEPAQLAVREAIEAAVIHLTVQGIRDRYFELKNPGDWSHPVIQSYLAEGFENFNDGEPIEEGAFIPRRPLTADRVPLAVPTLAAQSEENPVTGRAGRGSDPAPDPVTEQRSPARPAAVAPQRVEGPAAPDSKAGTSAPPASAGPVPESVKAPPSAVAVPARPAAWGDAAATVAQPAPSSPSSSPAAAGAAPASPAPSSAKEDIFRQYWKIR